jgi:glycosyltransferase involved in cell wall biosynthesis
MKYWILTTEFTQGKNEEIGAYVNNHVQIFADKGHEILVIQGGFDQEQNTSRIAANVTLHSFSLNNRTASSFLGADAALSFEFANEVINLLATNTPDVIEMQGYLGIGYYLLIRKYAGEPLLKNIPVIVTGHMPSFITNEYNHIAAYRFPQYWTGEMEKFCMLAADLFISPGKHFVRLLRQNMPEAFPEQIAYLPYPVPITSAVPAGNPAKDTFLVTGKMSYAKGTMVLLQTAARLWKKGMDFQIHWIGNGDEFITTEGLTIGELVQKKYTNYINAGKLRLTSTLPAEELASQFSTARAVIVPSLADDLPYTALKAMAAGKVVLSSANGSQGELLEDNISGFIFDWEQPGSFEEKINQVLSLTDESIDAIGKKAREAVTICSPENYYAEKKRIITDLIRSAPARKNFPIIRPQPKQENTVQPTLEDGLTVSIPYYNMGAFVEECVESVLASTYKNIKIIIVDDGSTDAASIATLNDIQRKYPDVKIIYQDNAGLSEARNTGLRVASTKYITFLDPDDTVQPDYFQKCIHVLNSYDNISFVSCWLKYFEAATGCWPSQNPELPYLLFHNTVHSGCLFKTADILQTGGYDKSLVYGMEDYEMAVHMVSKGFHGFTLPETLYNYRIRVQSMARGFTDDKKLCLYALISKKHKALFDKYGAESANILNANGPGYLHDNPTFASRAAVNAATPPDIRKALSQALYKYPKLHKLAVSIRNVLKRGE